MCDRRLNVRVTLIPRRCQVSGCWESIHPADFQHQNHAEDLPYTRECLQQICFRTHFHDRFQPVLRRVGLGFQKIKRRQFLFDGLSAVYRQFRQTCSRFQAGLYAKQRRSTESGC
jgi:hypothetical protein